MSDSELYVELDEDGSLLQMHKIVRCKDCLLYDEDRLTCVRDPFHRGESLPVEPDNFCSWAEPVEDGDGDA